MNLRNIYQQLGMETKFEEEISKLNHRIILIVDGFNSKFYEKERHLYEVAYPRLVKEFGFLIGESNIYRSGVRGIQYLELASFFRSDERKDAFDKNILNLTLLLQASKTVLIPDYNYLHHQIVAEVKRAIEISPIDIGYLFSGDTIIKKGAKELDEKLVLQNLTWLSKYPTVKQSFETSLKDYLGKNYPDAITNAYSSLEGLVKTFLNTDKQLDNQEVRKDLVGQLGLDGDWGQLLYNYCKLAHEFSSRHGKKETGKELRLPIELVEFYMYLTGAFIRLILTLSVK